MKTLIDQRELIARLALLLDERIELLSKEGNPRLRNKMRTYEGVIAEARQKVNTGLIEEPKLMRALNELNNILSELPPMSTDKTSQTERTKSSLTLKILVLDYLLFERLFSNKQNRFDAATKHKVLSAILDEKEDSIKKGSKRVKELYDIKQTTVNNRKHRLDVIDKALHIAKDLLADREFEQKLLKLKADTEKHKV